MLDRRGRDNVQDLAHYRVASRWIGWEPNAAVLFVDE